MAKLPCFSATIAIACIAGGCDGSKIERLRVSLLETDRQWVEAAQGDDADRVAAFWIDDAVIYTAGRPPVAGKQALRAMVAKNRSTPGFTIRWETTESVIARSGDLAYTFGPYRITAPRPDGSLVTQTGHSICVWRREHGTWKCSLEVHAPLPPPADKERSAGEKSKGRETHRATMHRSLCRSSGQMVG